MKARCLLLLALLGALWISGCAPRLVQPRLPLRGEALSRIRSRLENRGSDPLAVRDLGWLSLLYEGSSGESLRQFESSLRASAADPAALLGRALALELRSEGPQVDAAWTALLRGSLGQTGSGWSALRLLALRRLGALVSAGYPLDRALVLRVTREPDALARDRALAMLVQAERRRGNADELPRLAARRGCPEQWQVRGPQHHLPHLDLTRPFSGAAGETIRTRNCAVRLHAERSGVFELATGVESARAQPVLLGVETHAPWLLLVDGAVIHHQDRGDKRPAGRSWLRFSWPAGRHTLTLRLGVSTTAAPKITLAPEQSAAAALAFGAPSPVSAPPPDLQPRLLACSVAPEELLASLHWPDWYQPVAELIAAAGAEVCQDSDEAYRHYAAAERAAPEFAAAHLWHLTVMKRDPAVSSRVLAQRGRPVLERLLRRDPDLAALALQQAGLAVLLEQYDEALQLFQRGARRWPHDFRWRLGLQLCYRARSWSAEELAALQEARSLQPRNCALIEDLIAVRRSRREVSGLGELVEQAVGCNATSHARASLLREAGRLSEAIAEQQRLLRLAEDATQLRRDLAQLYLAAGRRTEAAREIERLVREQALPGDVLHLADLRAAGGDLAGAAGLLRRQLLRNPTTESLRQALERLEAMSLLEDQRHDGLAVIKAYLSKAGRYQAPAVLVQDRMVTRILASGAKLMLVHNIIQVLSKEGIERWGEVHVPARAEVLTLRSVKADGTTREPEQVAGKQTISLPDLEIGDFVEMEYLDFEAPPKSYDGSTPQRFYFGSFEVPMVVSDFLVQAPSGVSLQIETRGAAPPPVRTCQDGWVQLHWVARDKERLVGEPHSVAADEYVASVKIAVGANWESLRRSFAEQALVAFRSNQEVRELAAHLGDASRAPRAFAEAAYRLVLERIDEAGTAFGSAADALSRRIGSRYAVLVSLLRAAGLGAELWLVRPVTADQATQVVPDTRTFSAPVVRCPLPGGDVFLDPRDPAVPFGFLAPQLRGGLALRASDSGPVFAKVPERLPGSEEGRRIKTAIQLNKDGNAQVKVSELLEGSMAIVFRSLLRKAGALKLRKLFEQSALSLYFPGAVLERVDFDESRPGNFGLHYRFSSSGLARREDGGMQLGIGLFPPELTRIYLGLATRAQTLQVATHVPIRSELLVALPPGWQAARLPPPVRLRSEFGSFSRTVTSQSDGRLRVDTELSVHFRRVPSSSYSAFAEFVRQIDDLFRTELRLTRMPSQR